MGKQKAPGSREEESWFSEEQLDQLEPADSGKDELGSPIPTQMVSNGEYLPNPQTEEQKGSNGGSSSCRPRRRSDWASAGDSSSQARVGSRRRSSP